jgi:sugar phosphate isomerase/epimerase
MKIGVLTALMQSEPLEKALDFLVGEGVEAVELGAGGYVGNAHCNSDELLASAPKRQALLDLVESRGLEISALSVHGNPLHPNPDLAKKDHEAFEKACRLAEQLGLTRVNGFSGCPGDSPGAKYPNWITCAWPPDFQEVLKWQWEEAILPHWSKAGQFARDHGVNFGFEMHPGMSVYNPETLLRLRRECGDNLGANFDPSHLFWQGMDPLVAVRALEVAIYHVHAKDTRVDPDNTRLNGCNDTKPYTDEINRSWIFRTVGYGHGEGFWRDFVSALSLVGYDFVLSIEHEDGLMSPREGLRKAVAFLKGILITEPPGEAYWA